MGEGKREHQQSEGPEMAKDAAVERPLTGWMHATAQEDAPGEGAEDEAGGSFTARARAFVVRRKLLSAAMAGALLAAGTVAVASAGSESCWELPAEQRALADDPAAATAYLDPGDELAGLDRARNLFGHDRVCGDGAAALGRTIEAATGSSGKGAAKSAPHTEAQARSAYAVVSALTEREELPEGIEPGLARMLATYLGDFTKEVSLAGDDPSSPVSSPGEPETPGQADELSDAYVFPHDAHVQPRHDDVGVPTLFPRRLITACAKDPEAMAVLLDAHRALFAHYLEMLDRRGLRPGVPAPDAGEGSVAPSPWELWDLAGSYGSLLKARVVQAHEGSIELDSYDATVRSRLRGAYTPVAGAPGPKLTAAAAANRPVSGRLEGDWRNGRTELSRMIAAWGKARGAEASAVRAIDQGTRDEYLQGYQFPN